MYNCVHLKIFFSILIYHWYWSFALKHLIFILLPSFTVAGIHYCFEVPLMFFNDFIFFLRIKSTASSSPIVEIGEQHCDVWMWESVCLYVRFVGLMEHGFFIIIMRLCCQQKKYPCSHHTQTCVSDAYDTPCTRVQVHEMSFYLNNRHMTVTHTLVLYSVSASSFMFFTRSTLMSKCFCIGGGWEIESVTGEEEEREGE